MAKPRVDTIKGLPIVIQIPDSVCSRVYVSNG